MRKLIFFLCGGLAGLLASFIAIYAIGIGLEAAGLSLYGSEREQQRNFNVAVVFAVVVTALCGWWAKRRA